jgi:hypothetical protein
MKLETSPTVAVPAGTAYTLETVLSPRSLADLGRDVDQLARRLIATGSGRLGPRLARLLSRPGIADEAPDARRLEIELDARTAERLHLAARRHGTTPEAITRAALHLRALDAARVNRRTKRAALESGAGLTASGKTPPADQLLSVAVRVSDYHLEGMALAALASTRGGGTADGWAERTLATGTRIPRPRRACTYPDRPTGHVVTVTLPRRRIDELDALAQRHGRPLRRWLHAVLVEASAKYRATLDRQAGQRPGPDIEPAPDSPLPGNVIPFFTGHFRRA